MVNGSEKLFTSHSLDCDLGANVRAQPLTGSFVPTEEMGSLQLGKESKSLVAPLVKRKAHSKLHY